MRGILGISNSLVVSMLRRNIYIHNNTSLSLVGSLFYSDFDKYDFIIYDGSSITFCMIDFGFNFVA